MDEKTSIQENEWTSGQAGKKTRKQVNEWTSGRENEYTSERQKNTFETVSCNFKRNTL